MHPPVSVKAALRSGDTWVLLRNDRGEWELPGGRIDPSDESLQDALKRECREELGLVVDVGGLVDSWLFEVVAGKRVVIVCFAASCAADAAPIISGEHDAVGLFSTDEIAAMATTALPDGYRQAILSAALL